MGTGRPDGAVVTDFVEDLARRTAARGWVGAPTLWGLVESRAAATPDALLAREDTGRELTFAQFEEACLRGCSRAPRPTTESAEAPA